MSLWPGGFRRALKWRGLSEVAYVYLTGIEMALWNLKALQKIIYSSADYLI